MRYLFSAVVRLIPSILVELHRPRGERADERTRDRVTLPPEREAFDERLDLRIRVFTRTPWRTPARPSPETETPS